MDGNSEIPRNEGRCFESILVEKAVETRVMEISEEIFSNYYQISDTNLTLLGLDPYSNIFLSDILKNLKKLYKEKYPNKDYIDSKINSHYLYSEKNKPLLGARDLLLVSVLINNENKEEIAKTRELLKRETPRSIKIGTFISSLSDEDINQLDVEYKGFLFPDIEIIGYGFGKPSPEIGDRIIYAKEKE